MRCFFCNHIAKHYYLSYELCLDCYKEQMIICYEHLPPEEVLKRLEELEAPNP